MATYVDLEGSVRTEAELVNKYRDMTLNSEVDSAIEDILDEAIITEDGEKTVQIILDDVDNGKCLTVSRKSLKKNSMKSSIEFNTHSYDIFRRWYVDGRIYYHVMVDVENPSEGIKEMRYLDPRRVRKIREVTKVRNKEMPNLPIQKHCK